MRVETLETRHLLAGNIFYDFVEDGELQGGRIKADVQNPLHVAIDKPGMDQRVTYQSEKIVDNGPNTNRIDLVFLGDGYTVDELDDYAAHVENAWPTFFSESPLDAYASYFNIHRMDVISNESGVDNDPTKGIRRDTALDMGFWCSDIERLLCVNVTSATLAVNTVEDWDQMLVLGNTSKYGGAGYGWTHMSTFSGDNNAAIEIGLHEFGHAFADLADEYFNKDGSRYSGSEFNEANVSIYSESELESREAKWYRWLDEAGVGAFEGGRYKEHGVFRPTNNSKMRNLDRPFGPVNTEQFVLSMYEDVRPIDNATPASGAYDQNTTFFVQPLVPLTHQLDVQWSLDGTPIEGANGPSLAVSSLDLTSGLYTVGVRVVDNTDMVRDESARTTLMTEERQWTVNVETTAGPRVVGSSLSIDDTVPTGDLVYLADFDQPLHAAVLDVFDVQLAGTQTGTYAPSSVNYHAETMSLSARFEGLPEDHFTLRLKSGDGALESAWGDDLDGEPGTDGGVPSGDGLAGGDFVVSFSTNQAPRVEQVSINAGLFHPPSLPAGEQPSSWATQRSLVRNIRIEFSEPVELTVDDVSLVATNFEPGGGEIELESEQFQWEGPRLTVDLSGVTIPNGPLVLEIGNAVSDTEGTRLDGDGDGRPGDAFLYFGDANNGFFRQRSDWSGDGGVSILDFPTFVYWFSKPVTVAPAYLDLNGDGGVSLFDFPMFSDDFGSNVFNQSIPAITSLRTMEGRDDRSLDPVTTTLPLLCRATQRRGERQSTRTRNGTAVVR